MAGCLLASALSVGVLAGGCRGCDDGPRRGDGYYAPPRFDTAALGAAQPTASDLERADGGAGDPGERDGSAAAGADTGHEEPPPLPDLGAMPLPDFAALYRTVEPVVVSIYTTRRPVPERLPVGPSRFADSVGSGIVLTTEGVVLTNHHVVENAKGIWVRLYDGRTFRATVVGTDPPTDLALLKVGGVGVPLVAAALGDSDALEVGDWVLAVGNPLGLEHTVTRGIVSGKGRREIGPATGGYVDYLQTDAAINPGSSGGPLFDLGGRVVGINAAISPEGRRLSFAIPVNMAKEVVDRLQQSGRVKRGWLGVVTAGGGAAGDSGGAPDGPAKGVRVAEVVPGSPADRAGLQPGDVIVAIDGERLDAPFDLRWRVAMAGVGKRIQMKVRREGESRLVSVKLGTLGGAPPGGAPQGGGPPGGGSPGGGSK